MRTLAAVDPDGEIVDALVAGHGIEISQRVATNFRFATGQEGEAVLGSILGKPAALLGGEASPALRAQRHNPPQGQTGSTRVRLRTRQPTLPARGGQVFRERQNSLTVLRPVAKLSIGTLAGVGVMLCIF